MKNITKEELIKYIKSQPPEKPVNMSQTSDSEDCGCIMVQYAKEKLKLKNFGCGFQSIAYNSKTGKEMERNLEFDIRSILPMHLWWETNTFGDIQKLIDKA